MLFLETMASTSILRLVSRSSSWGVIVAESHHQYDNEMLRRLEWNRNMESPFY
jgi:hypothetical protein